MVASRSRLLVTVALFMAWGAQAHTSQNRQFVCPLDGVEFTALMDMSGTTFGQMLDMRATGPTASPWALAVCPKDHFVLFQDKYSKAEIADLRAYVSSAAYQRLVPDTSSYFLLAHIYEHLKKDAYTIAWAYLHSSWELESSPAGYRRAAVPALKFFQLSLQAPKNQENRQTAELLAGELERRLGDFPAAQRRFERLSKLALYQKGFFSIIVAKQLTLIAAKDSAPHEAR